ncbi:MAG: hypothetical protein HY840_05275 [Bacteroidetes bacterium]|nr:hypothetical protein [Bacteroidota bacterium]
MSSKNKIAILLVIILASAALWLYRHNSKSTIRKELYDFSLEDTSSINKIYMVNMAGKQITLEKIKPGNWQVNEKFKARNDAIKTLLTTIKDMRVKAPVAKSAIENVSKDLASRGTKVEIYQNNELVKMYYVGDDTQDGLGTFMLLNDIETGENSSLPFVMSIPGFNGFLSVRYFLDEEMWRDKTIYGFYPDQISSVSLKNVRFPDSSFTISLSSDMSKIALSDNKGNNIADFDTLKAKRYLTYFSNLQYESLKNDMRKSLRDSVFSKNPVHIIELKDRQGKIHNMKTFAKPADDPNKTDEVTGKHITEDIERMYALFNEDKDVATIQYFAFGKMFHGLSYFKKDINPAKKK